MSNISRTFIFPVPSVWKGQDQDDSNVGIDTYNGPANLTVWYKRDGNNGAKTSEDITAFDTADPQLRDPAIDMYAVQLDASKYTLHAAAIWGGISTVRHIEVTAGPSDEPNPVIRDPYHMTEVFDMRSFKWEPDANSGAGGWSTPKFANQQSDPDTADDNSFGWNWVRSARNDMLASCDSRIAEDMPTSVKDEWKTYRQKLRDLPISWAGVGTATHLIVWPPDPDEQKKITAGIASAVPDAQFVD